MSNPESVQLCLYYLELSMSSHTEILYVITGDDALKASSGVSSSSARCCSPGVSRAVRLKYLPLPLLPALSSASLTLCLPRHLLKLHICACFYLASRGPESLPSAKSLLPLLTTARVKCVFKMCGSKTCEVEIFSNSAGTSQWKLGESAFSPEWTCFTINSGEMCVRKANLNLSIFLVSRFKKKQIGYFLYGQFHTDMKKFAIYFIFFFLAHQENFC